MVIIDAGYARSKVSVNLTQWTILLFTFELNWAPGEEFRAREALGEFGYPWNLLKEVSVAPTVARNLSR